MTDATARPDDDEWPALDPASWADTRATLHMCLQVVGKVKLALSPHLNQWWQVGFELTARGLGTGTVPHGSRTFDVELDFVEEVVRVRVSDGGSGRVALGPRPVSTFHHELVTVLADLGLDVAFSTMPSEVGDGIPFELDTAHASYDGDAVRRWWRVMLNVERVIDRYRTAFRGKASPVLFYWGALDLSHTRFNGERTAPPSTDGRIMEYAEDEDNFAIGFWPGGPTFPHPTFYAYLNPAPEGIEHVTLSPEQAHYDPQLRELVLLYDDALRHPSPSQAVAQFFDSAYEATTRLAGWDTERLTARVPQHRTADDR